MHSIEGYIQRLPTEKLEILLREYGSSTDTIYQQAVQLAREVLLQRSAAEQEHPGS